MEERLQKLISSCGLASRRTAEEWITAGRVTVNGEKAHLGDRADLDRDKILVDGKPLNPGGSRTYLMLNKPRGYVTTLSDEKGRKTVADLVSGCGARVWPVGRLDLDSEGLLLLTDDGELTNRLLHPSGEVEKEYLVKVSNRVSDEDIRRLRAGVQLDDGRMTSPADVHLVRYEAFSTVLLVSIHEGRNRQVRRMFAAVGHEVVSLKRVGFATIKLHDLPRGQWRRLTDVEVKKLKEL